MKSWLYNLLLTISLSCACASYTYGQVADEETKKKAQEFEVILKQYEEQIKKNPTNLKLIAALGDVYYSLKDYPAAIKYYQQGLELDPNNHALKTSLALAYLNNNDLKQSRQLLDELIPLEPDNTSILGALGRIEALSHHYEIAETYYQKALQNDPQHFTTLFYLGDLRIQQKRYAEAEEIFKKLLQRDPKAVWIKPSYERATLGPVIEKINQLQKTKNYSEALKIYQEQLKNNPESIELYLGLSRLYTSLSQYQDAISLLNKGLEIYPNETSLKLALGYTYLAKKDLVEARKLFRSVLQTPKGHSEAWGGLGKIEALKGHVRRAQTYYARSLKIDPHNTLTLSYLAQQKVKEKDYPEAIRIYNQIGQIDPEATWIIQAREEAKIAPLLDQIQTEETALNFSEAERLYQRLLFMTPNQANSYLKAGNFHTSRRNYAQAIEIYRKGLEIDPNDVPLLLALANTYLKDDQGALSLSTFLEVLKLEPDNSEAMTGIGRLLYTIGDLEGSKNLYLWVLAQHPQEMTTLSYYADLLMAEKKYSLSKKVFTKILSLDSDAQWAKDGLFKSEHGPALEKINALKEQKNFSQALLEYQKLLKIDPPFEIVYLEIGNLYRQQNQVHKAIQTYLQGLKNFPFSSALQTALGYAYLQLNDLKKAQLEFRNVLKKDFANADALAGLGQIAYQNKDQKKALEYYHQALSINSHNIQALAYLGEFWLAQHDFLKAEEAYLLILRINPQAYWAKEALEQVRAGPLLVEIEDKINQNRFEQAVSLYQHLISENPTYPGYYIKLGKLYLEKKQSNDAIGLYFKALQILPQNVELQIALAFALIQNGELQKAQSTFKNALELDPNNPEAIAGLGKVAELSGNLPEAAFYYQSALKIDPNNLTSLIYQAEFDIRQGHYEGAVKLYRKVHKLLPSALWVEQAIEDAKHGKLLAEIKKKELAKEEQEAEVLWLQLLQEAPHVSDYYLRAGFFYQKFKQYDKAINLFSKGIQEAPKSSPLYAALGLAYLSKKEQGEAYKAFLKSYKLDPQNPDALAGLGYVAFLKGHYEKAEKLIKSALAIDPNRVAALSSLGELWMKLKRYPEAQHVYQKLLQLNPGEKWIELALDDAKYGNMIDHILRLIEEKNFTGAAEGYQELLNLSPNNAHYYYGLGQMQMRLRQYQKSIETNREGLQKNPEDNELRIALGFAYFFNNNLSEARDTLTEALKIDAKNPEALAGLGRVYAMEKNDCEAETLYWKALTIDPKNFSALSFLSELLMRQKRYPEAQEIYLTLWQLMPGEEWVQRGWQDAEDGPLMDLANRFSGEEQFEIALRLYQDLLANSPRDPSRYLALGQTYVNLKHYYTGIDIFQQGLEIDSEAWPLWRAQAFTYILLEEFDSAENLFLFVLENIPDDAEALAGLGRIEALNGSRCAAKEYYYQALAADGKNLTALSFLAELYEEERYNFSGLQVYENINDVLADSPLTPKPKWARRGYSNSLNIAFATVNVGGSYHQEDQWDPFSRQWSATYKVYGGKALINYPIRDDLLVWGSFADQFYVLKDLLNHTSIYSFDVQRFHLGARWVYRPCFFVDAKIGLVNYSAYKYSTFKMQKGTFGEPSLTLTYHQPKEKATLSFLTDSDLVARDFSTNRAKIVRYHFLNATYERKIIKRGWIGGEATAYWFRDYVDNNSQKVLGWFQWRPPVYWDYILFRYHVKYQTFAKNIPDYYTYKPQIINQLQMTLEKNWRVCWADTLYTSLTYGHGWQNTYTRFTQIIVVDPLNTTPPYVWDNREYNLVVGTLIYRCDRLQLTFNADYYRDTEKYTMWTVAADLRWRF